MHTVSLKATTKKMTQKYTEKNGVQEYNAK